jgi:uncharacterized protein (TIGR02118 family)
MIKAITLLYRRPDLSIAEFQRHWRDQHADIIAALPGVRCYVQSTPVPESCSEDAPVFDGFAELWADDTQALRDLAAGPQYAAVLDDEQRFLDRSATALILVDDIELKSGVASTGAIKRIACLTRRPGLTVEQFQRQWRAQAASLVVDLPGLIRQVQSQPRTGAYRDGRQPRYDGFDIAWFADRAALQAARDSTAGEVARARWAELTAAPLEVVVTTEQVVVGTSGCCCCAPSKLA